VTGSTAMHIFAVAIGKPAEIFYTERERGDADRTVTPLPFDMNGFARSLVRARL